MISESATASVDHTSVDKILTASGLTSSELGMLVQDEQGTIFALNSDQQFVPASLTKILTAGASLNMLHTNYAFKTELLTDGPFSDRVLKGALYVKAGGDPSFHTTKLQRLLAEFAQQRARRIEGDIIIDDSRFDDYKSDNWNTVKNMISSWKEHSSPLFVDVDPPEQYMPPLIRFWRRTERRLRTIVVSPSNDLVVYKNMTEPDLWTGYKMIRLFQQSGITVSGKVRRGTVPPDARVLAEVTSPLTEVVSSMMKSSDNYIAEMLTKNLAAEAQQKPVTIEAGLQFIRQFMDQAGIPSNTYELTSAAGYSNQNLISPNALCKVLRFLKNDNVIFPTFYSSLPVAGIDGTLRHRMRKTAAQGRIAAKTGYLEGVVGLAGFVNRPDAKVLTFAFMYNGHKPAWIVKSTFDKICVELVR